MAITDKQTGLRDNHKAIADEYIANGFNGKQAVLSVQPNISPEYACVKANRVISNVNVGKYIAGKMRSKQELLDDLVRIKNKTEKERKYNSTLRSIELEAKIAGHLTENNQVTAVFQDFNGEITEKIKKHRKL